MANYLLFVRHGETVGNQEQIAHGQGESPLNARGVAQAKTTAQRLRAWHRPYHRIYASPLSRARTTAAHIADVLGLPVHEHEGLMEGSLGDWEGATYAELNEWGFAKHSIADDDFCAHNGESPNALAARMMRTIETIRASHAGENIIVVSHGAAISHGLSKLLDTRPVFGHQYLMVNCAITELALRPEPKIEHLNVNDHLDSPLLVGGESPREENQ